MNIPPLVLEGEALETIERRQFDIVVDTEADRRALGATLAKPKPPRMLIGERAHRFHFLDVNAVDYLEVDGNYVTIHVGTERFLMRATLKQLSVELTDCDFVRIDRSCLVNLRRVDYVERIEGGQFVFALRSGERVLSSRERAGRIVRLLKSALR